jgi:hypothetical protein
VLGHSLEDVGRRVIGEAKFTARRLDDSTEGIRNFVKKVKEREYIGLNLTYKVHEGKDHYTVWVPTLLEGIEMYLTKEVEPTPEE